MKALILDKDGTLFPYSLWINPIRRVFEENLPMKRYNEEKRKKIVDDFLSVLSIRGNTIGSGSLLYERKKRLQGALELIFLTLKHRLPPLRTMRGFLKIKKRYNYGFKEELEAYDLNEVKDTLIRLEDMGIVTALFSNDSPSSVKLVEERLDFVFDYHVDSSSRIRKPDPKTVLIFSTLMNISPEDIVLLSDTPEDLKMGRKSGCGKIVAIEGSVKKEKLFSYADCVISRFKDILDFF